MGYFELFCEDDKEYIALFIKQDMKKVSDFISKHNHKHTIINETIMIPTIIARWHQ